MKVPSPDTLTITHPDDLTFADLFRIKAATGVDLIGGAVTILEQLPAVVWWAWAERDGKKAPTWAAFAGAVHPKDLGPHGEILNELEAARVEALERVNAERDAQLAVAEQIEATREPGEPEPEPEEPSTDPTGSPV